MKIWQQVIDAIYPFKEQGLESAVFIGGDGRIKIPTVNGKRKPGFFALTLSELPPATIRRFLFCDLRCLENDQPEPTDQEFKKFRRLLLGTARRKLMNEQVRRIKALDHLPGRGRMGINDNERSEIREEFSELHQQLKVANVSRPATTAAMRVAQRHGYKLRNIWKILKRRSAR